VKEISKSCRLGLRRLEIKSKTQTKRAKKRSKGGCSFIKNLQKPSKEKEVIKKRQFFKKKPRKKPIK